MSIKKGERKEWVRAKGSLEFFTVSAALALSIALLLPALAEKGYPIEGGGELKIFYTMAGGAAYKSHADILVFKEMEKRTGIKIKWIEPVQGLDAEVFNLLLAARDLPDVFKLPSTAGGWRAYPAARISTTRTESS